MTVPLVLLATAVTTVAANRDLPFVSPMFGDHMVMQRGKTNTIWGWSAHGEKITVEMAGQTAAAITAHSGRWEARLVPPSAPGPYTLRISGLEQREFEDVLVGDVWLCGGQSNMELPLDRTRNGQEAIKAANHPNVRLFTVKRQTAYSPKHLVAGTWKTCTPETVTQEGGFSAVGYYFARRIQRDIDVPIGLIKDCVGGTPAESWTSAESLKALKDFDVPLKEIERLRAKGGTEHGSYVMHWYEDYDQGLRGKTWNAPDLDEREWRTATIPGGFVELGVPDTPAVCYFRKTLMLPAPLPPGKSIIHLGVIEKMDTTYINGQWIAPVRGWRTRVNIRFRRAC